MTSTRLTDHASAADATRLDSDSARLYATDEARWRAVLARDRAADDHFVIAVRTTGVYARPSSSARTPNRDNVEFFSTAADAEAAGYRASRRSSADASQAADRRTDLVKTMCRLIEAADTPPALHELATHAGLSPYHLHRLFKEQTGLTPKAYASAFRARRLRERLQASASKASPGPASGGHPSASHPSTREAPAGHASTGTVTQAIFDAGFNSSSRFYEDAGDRLGMPPRAFQAGGTHTDIHFAVGQSALGAVLVARSARGVCAILLGDDPAQLLQDLQDQFPKAHLIGADPDFESWVAQVVGLVEAPGLGLNLPLDVRGTAFQERVWRALRDIPPGTTISYTDLAARIGSPAAVRAVAQACGANPLAVAIPCHRVVRINGDLAGYRWGVARKEELLRREAKDSQISSQ